MQANDQLSITLNPDLTRRIRAKIAAGHYRTELEVIEDGLDALDPQNADLDLWLSEEVLPAYDAFERDPSRGRTPNEVRAILPDCKALLLKRNDAVPDRL